MHISVKALLGMLLLSAAPLSAQVVDPGRASFDDRCGKCHGGDGNGGEMGPPIAARLNTRTDAQLATFIRDGVPTRGMPAHVMADPEMTALVRYLRTLQPQPA